MSGVISEGEVLWRNREDTARVTVQVDVDPGPPEDEGAMPTVRIESRPWVHAVMVLVHGGADYGFNAPAVFRHCVARWPTATALDVFNRYLRVFHGTTTTHTYAPPEGGDYSYLTFDTATWRAAVGVEEDHQGTAETSFEEYRAYLTRNVWGLQLEHKVRRLSRATDLYHGEITAWEEEDEWEHQDSIWGLYSDDRDQALETARDYFEDYFDQPDTTNEKET